MLDQMREVILKGRISTLPFSSIQLILTLFFPLCEKKKNPRETKMNKNSYLKRTRQIN